MLKSAKKSPVFFVYIILALSTLAIFWQVHNFDFVNYDDPDYVSENQHVLNGLTTDSFVWAFTTSHSANWHPLTWLSLMLDCQLFGPNPGRIHLVNVLLHIINTLLLFAILKKTTSALWPSAFVAALFALHPIHVESVAWIAERKDALSTFFFMLTLLTYCRYTQKQNKSRYFLVLLAFALGLMAKPMLVTLPFVLLLFDYWPLGRLGAVKKKKADISQKSFGFLVLEKLPFFIPAVISSVITFFVQRSGGVVNALSFGNRAANALLSYTNYIGKMFWPQNLAVIYPLYTDSFTPWLIAICSLLLLVISVFVIRFRQKCPYLPVGWFWFVGTLVPVIGLVQVGLQAYADRYTYIPYIGLFIMIAWSLPELLSKLPQRKIVLGAAMAVVLVSLGIAAHRQASYWKNSSTLFSHAIEVTQNNYVAHNCLARDAYQQGNIALTIEHCAKALQINPDYADALLGLGCALIDRGDIAQAIGYIKRSLEIEPDNVGAKNNLAWILATCSDPNMRNPSDAIRIAQEACIATNYDEAGILDTLAAAYASAGRFAEAIDTAQKALSEANPNNKDILKAIHMRLDLYKASNPYIEAAKKTNK